MKLEQNEVTMAPYMLVDADNVIQDVSVDSKYSKIEIPDDYFVKFNVENDDESLIGVNIEKS